MAAADLRNELTCSICLSIYNDPVCLLCGHSFCRGCIVWLLDTQDKTGGYSCPECREKYEERPALHKNKTLGNIAARFLSTHPDQDGTGVSGNRSCSALNEPLNDHCTEDSACGTSCQAEGPWDHRVRVLNVATPMQRERLRNVMEDRYQEREAMQRERLRNVMEDLYQEREAMQRERLRNVMEDRYQEREAMQRERLRKTDKIEELCNIEDLLTFLPAQEMSGTEGFEDRETNDITVAGVGDLDLCQILKILHISFAGFRAGNEKRKLYGKCMRNLLLDRKRTGRNIRISEDRKRAFHADNINYRNYDPDDYQDAQVLSTTIFNSGHYYWDVEASQWGDLRLGVFSISTGDRGTRPWIGDHKKSWCLFRCQNNTKYMVKHDNKHEELVHVPSCRKYRVSLDYEAGLLSFYELSDPIRLLHTFTATFTEPLHAGFWVWRWQSNDAWVKIIS